MTKLLVLNSFSIEPDKLVADEHGNQRKVEVAKGVKRWWTASVDGKIALVVRYGSKQSLADELQKRTNEQKEQKKVFGLSAFFALHFITSDCANY